MKVFSRCMLVLILVTVICGVGGYAYENETITPMYSSTTQLYVVPGEQNEASVRASNGGLNNDFMIIFTSSVVISEAQKQLGTSEDIAQYLTVKSPDNSNIVEITCTNPDQNTAKQYVDAVATTALKTTSIIPVESIQILTVGTVSEDPVKPDLMKNTITIAVAGAGICLILELIFVLIRGAFKKPKDNSDDELEYEKHYGKYAMLSQPAMSGYIEARNAHSSLNGVHNNGIKDNSIPSYDHNKYAQDDVYGRDSEDLSEKNSDKNSNHKSRKLSAAEKFRYQTEQYETYGTINPSFATVKDNSRNTADQNTEQEVVNANQAVSDIKSLDGNQNGSINNSTYGSNTDHKDALNHNLDHDMDDILDDDFEDDYDDEPLYDPLADLPEDPLDDALEDTLDDSKDDVVDNAENHVEDDRENDADDNAQDDAMQDVAVSAVDLEVKSESGFKAACNSVEQNEHNGFSSIEKMDDGKGDYDKTYRADSIDDSDSTDDSDNKDVIPMNHAENTASGFHVIDEDSTMDRAGSEIADRGTGTITDDVTDTEDTTVVTGVFGVSEDMKSTDNDEVKETLDIEVTNKTDVQNDLQNDTQKDNQKDALSKDQKKGSSPKILARIRK